MCILLHIIFATKQYHDESRSRFIRLCQLVTNLVGYSLIATN